MDERAIVIDTSKCMGCRGCQVACKQWNQLPAVATKNTGSYENPPTGAADTFTKVAFKEEVIDGKLNWLFRKEQCMHCTRATCVEMCPVDARAKDEFGFTEVDREKCIGCGLCVSVCPFQVPYLDADRKAKNCWFCLDRVLNGMTPACAKACPTGAIKFGKRADMLTYARDIRDRSNGKLYMYGETQFMGLHMLYLLTAKPEVFGLSDEGKVVIKLDKIEAYAMLEKKMADSPLKTEVLTMAALKYFGNVHI